MPAAPAGRSLPLAEAREQFERDYILQTLAAQQGNMSRTADVLGVERSNLYKKMKAFGIAPAGETEAGLRLTVAVLASLFSSTCSRLNPSSCR